MEIKRKTILNLLTCEINRTFILICAVIVALTFPLFCLGAVHWTYAISKVRVLANGKWHLGKKVSENQWLVVSQKAWPDKVSVEVEWEWTNRSGRKICKNTKTDEATIFKQVNGAYPVQNMGRAEGSGKDPEGPDLKFTFPDIPRTGFSGAVVVCRRVPRDNSSREGEEWITLSFDPLVFWKPQETPDTKGLEIIKPAEGSVIPPNTVLDLVVKRQKWEPGRLDFELQKALEIKRGSVGDITLPENKPLLPKGKPLNMDLIYGPKETIQ